MVLRCSLLGTTSATDVEREREELGGEVVVTVQDEECSRCGQRNVISENTEVTNLSAGTGSRLALRRSRPQPTEPPIERDAAADSAAAAIDSDAAFIDADDADLASEDAELVDSDSDASAARTRPPEARPTRRTMWPPQLMRPTTTASTTQPTRSASDRRERRSRHRRRRNPRGRR